MFACKVFLVAFVASLASESAAKLTLSQMMDEEAGTMLSKDSAEALKQMDREELTELTDTVRRFEALMATTTTTEEPVPEEVEEVMEAAQEPQLEASVAEGAAIAHGLAGALLFSCVSISVVVGALC